MQMEDPVWGLAAVHLPWRKCLSREPILFHWNQLVIAMKRYSKLKLTKLVWPDG